MTEAFLSSLQILKLGHNIQEIRERALQNILSKLKFGPIHETDLGRIKEILQKLFAWFYKSPLTHEETVLKLIKQILESHHGPSLIKFYNPKMLVDELVNIGKVVNKPCHSILDEIVNVIDANRTEEIYLPRLESELPLSARSGEGDRIGGVGSTATTIRANVEKEASVELRLGHIVSDHSDSTNITTSKSLNVDREPCRYYTLPWQPLIGPDCHVLESIEESLRNPSQAIVLMNSCEFFNEVLLQDFAAEVFLQRPGITMLFQHLLSTCRSSRITTATLVCLNKLTKSLKTRIHFFSDPNTYNLKINAFISSSLPSSASGDHSNISTVIYPSEDISFLKTKQLPIPQFCLSTINCVLNYLYVKPHSVRNSEKRPPRKICQVGINTSLLLLHKLIDVLKLCLTSEVWKYNSSNSLTKEIVQMFQECLIKYGDLLEHFRIDLVSNHNQSKRITYLVLISNIRHLLDILPSDDMERSIPKCLKTSLSAIILDASLSRIFPEMHQSILERVKTFEGKYEVDSCSKYEEMEGIFDSMTSAVNFLDTFKDLSLYDSLNLVKKGLISLEFHRDFSFIHKYLDLCSSRLSLNCYEENVFETIDYINLALLLHTDKEIREKMYAICRKIVVETVGTKFSSNTEPGSQILFLLRPMVLKEIILHGLSTENELIGECANDIVIYILKSKILVSPVIWQKTIEVLIQNLHLLLCYTSNKTSLSRTLMNMLDPDKAENLNIPKEQVLKGNCCLLFSHNALFRAEAISRICWLLSVEPGSLKLLPKLNNLHDKSLGLICQLSRKHDLNKSKSSQHFYQPSSLHQVMDLLSSTGAVEPVIRRSALIQISVMTEDPLLHVVFQQRDGVNLMITAMCNALSESNYAEYPDSVVPILATLKNLSLYSAAVREELGCNMEVLNFIIRSLVLFCTDDRAKQDGSILLFLLLFNSVLKGSPNKHDVSIPPLLMDKLHTPFICGTDSRNNLPTLPSLADRILTDKWCLSALRIHWNSEWFGGFKKILSWDEISYDAVPFSNNLKLSQSDLDGLKYASLEYCIQENLKEISTASCENVANAINLLTNCINLYNLTKNDFTSQANITRFQWRESFSKFIESSPASNEDSVLLTHVLNFLVLLTPVYKTSDDHCWISSILKSKTHCLIDLLDPQFSNNLDSRKISQALFKLISVCASNEQSFLCLYKMNSAEGDISEWHHLIVQIGDHLKFNDADHFYNLAYLDSLLSCLVQLTLTLGWSNKHAQHTTFQCKQLLSKLISSLCKLLEAFNSSKSLSASSSLMGLNTTRNVLIILNHILVEVQHFNLHDWEDFYLDDSLSGGNILTDLSSLLSNRDVILRAAVLQLFTGFAFSLKLAISLIQNFRYSHLGVWEFSLSIILDHEEANIVKENVAALLSNIIYHAVQHRDNIEIIAKLLPLYSSRPSVLQSLMKFLEENQFFKEMEIILNNLYIEKDFYYDCTKFDPIKMRTNSQYGSSCLSSKKEEYVFAYTKNIPITVQSLSSNEFSSISDSRPILSTPGFVKNLAQFVNQLLLLGSLEMSDILHDNNIIRLFFKCIIVPSKEIHNSKDLASYCEIVFMNKSIINTISMAVNASSVFKQNVIHTRDCLNVLMTLLNSNVFCVELEQLLHLRNDLWLEIYKLLTNILQPNNDSNINLCKSIESVNIILSVIEECGFEMFIDTLCDSIGRHNLPDLQQSAITVLVSLLRIATFSEDPKNTMQTLFDTTISPRCNLTLQFEEQLENISPNVVKGTNSPNSPIRRKTQMTLLENIYFGNVGTNLRTPRTRKSSLNDIDSVQTLKSGGELCKILIRLHELHTIRNIKKSKLKYVLISGITGVLYVSLEAKHYAFENNFMVVAIQQVKDIYINLSLESIASMRKVSEKKRLQLILKDVGAVFGLLTNFMIGSSDIKRQASVFGLADLVHKLWNWCHTQKGLIIDVLKMLCTFTTNCSEACQSLTTTSSTAGFGPRKQPNSACLLHVIVIQIGKEMDLLSRTHDLEIMQLCFHLLQNSFEVTECRNVIVKSNILQYCSRLHPVLTKLQKSYENIEFVWLNFLLNFTGYVEGQSCVTKIPDAFDLVLIMTNSPKVENKLIALMILRNLVFYAPNRPRLLNCDDFIKVLDSKLTIGSLDEQSIVVTILWSLAANNQKAKLLFKAAQLDIKLHEAVKVLQVAGDKDVSSEQLKQMYRLLNLLRTGDK